MLLTSGVEIALHCDSIKASFPLHCHSSSSLYNGSVLLVASVYHTVTGRYLCHNVLGSFQIFLSSITVQAGKQAYSMEQALQSFDLKLKKRHSICHVSRFALVLGGGGICRNKRGCAISVDEHEDKELKRGGCLWRDTPQTKHLCYWLKQKGWSRWWLRIMGSAFVVWKRNWIWVGVVKWDKLACTHRYRRKRVGRDLCHQSHRWCQEMYEGSPKPHTFALLQPCSAWITGLAGVLRFRYH